MTDALTRLHTAIEEYRQAKREEISERTEKAVNPYGQTLQQLNEDWGNLKAAHDAQIEDARQRYLKRREETLRLSAAWKADQPKTPKGKRGRPAYEWSPQVKIAVAQALEAGISKSTIRALLAITDTKRLDALIQEGQALNEAEL